MRAAPTALLLPALCMASGAGAQEPDSTPPSPAPAVSVAVLLAGVAGSAAGSYGGWEFGHWFASEADILQTGDDPGILVGFTGALIGSSLGAATATAIADWGRTPRTSFSTRLRHAAIGAGLGVVGFLIAAYASGDHRVGLVTYYLVQGLFTGFRNGRYE